MSLFYNFLHGKNSLQHTLNMSVTKLRVLCLHGWTQNEYKFSNQLSKLSESLKDTIEFTFITGPIIIPSKKQNTTTNNDDNKEETKNNAIDPKIKACWWRSNDDKTVYNGLEQSLSSIANIIKSKGPFDGLMGFSQGGAFAAIIIALMHNKTNSMKNIININENTFQFVW
eukprot:7347_1